MTLPSAWEFVVLALGAYRLTRLAGWDDFPLAVRLRDWLTGESVDGPRRPAVDHFLGCPFCVGFWISVAVYAAWLAAPRPTLYVMIPLALSAAVGLIAKNLDP